MLIQIQAVQVPKFWEVIKFAAVKSDGIEDDVMQTYCLTLLQDLLSGKKVCFVGQKEEKISFVVIIEIKFDNLRGYNYLHFLNIYSFFPQDDKIWKEGFTDLYKIALATKSKMIVGESGNDKIDYLAHLIGINVISKKYVYYL